MKTLVALIFSLALSVPAFALNGSGNVSNVVSLCVGGNTSAINPGIATASDPSTYKTLTVAQGDGTATHYYQVFDNSAMSAIQYRVGAGKHFYGICVCGASLQTSANQTVPFQLGEASATFTNGTATPPTGALYQTGAASAAGIALHVIETDLANGMGGETCQAVTYTFDPLYYPFIQSYIGAGTGIAYGSTYVLHLVGQER